MEKPRDSFFLYESANKKMLPWGRVAFIRIYDIPSVLPTLYYRCVKNKRHKKIQINILELRFNLSFIVKSMK